MISRGSPSLIEALELGSQLAFVHPDDLSEQPARPVRSRREPSRTHICDERGCLRTHVNIDLGDNFNVVMTG